MIFAVVEIEPGTIDFMIVRSGDARSLRGTHAFTGQAVSTALSNVVHMGTCGDLPAAVFQFCPAWLAAQGALSRTEKALPERTFALAANPRKKGGESKTEDDTGEGDDDTPLTKEERAEEKRIRASMPHELQYQSGRMKWTHISRPKRDKEQAHFLEAANEAGKRWSALDPAHHFGYLVAKGFIEKHRETMRKNPMNLFWCMCFAMLTANEGTAKAEANLRGFSAILKERLKRGKKIEVGVITREEFLATWGSGMAENKWAAFNSMVETFPAVAKTIQTTTLKDSALRRYIAREVGIPRGLGVTKFSFSLECFGQDVACLDRWMLRGMGAVDKVKVAPPIYFTADPGGYLPVFWNRGASAMSDLNKINRQIAWHRANSLRPYRWKDVPPPPWKPFSDGAYVLSEYGAHRFSGRDEDGLTTDPVLLEYEWWEARLTKSDYYREAVRHGAPNPLARAQWTMWEDIMRHHPKSDLRVTYATHSPLWAALEGKEALRSVMLPWARKIGTDALERTRRVSGERGRLLENPAPAGCLEVGKAYLAAKDESGSPRAKALYAEYARQTEALYKLIRLRVEFTEKDPYPSSKAMRDEVSRTGVMRVYSGGNDHPLLSPEQNLRGRAVHDLLAHLVCGCPFTATGEFNAFEAQAALYSTDLRSLLFTEIVGQTCAYLALGEKHAEQKVVFLPERDEALAQGMRRRFEKGLGLAGVVKAGWVDPRVFQVAESTGYSLRYAYAVLEEQKPAKVEAASANPRGVAPLWQPWLSRENPLGTPRPTVNNKYAPGKKYADDVAREFVRITGESPWGSGDYKRSWNFDNYTTVFWRYGASAIETARMMVAENSKFAWLIEQSRDNALSEKIREYRAMAWAILTVSSRPRGPSTPLAVLKREVADAYKSRLDAMGKSREELREESVAARQKAAAKFASDEVAQKKASDRSDLARRRAASKATRLRPEDLLEGEVVSEVGPALRESAARRFSDPVDHGTTESSRPKPKLTPLWWAKRFEEGVRSVGPFPEGAHLFSNHAYEIGLDPFASGRYVAEAIRERKKISEIMAGLEGGAVVVSRLSPEDLKDNPRPATDKDRAHARALVNLAHRAGTLQRMKEKYKVDLKIENLLACGASACAWTFGDYVFKLTTDPQDAQAALELIRLRRGPLPEEIKTHLARVVECCKISAERETAWVMVVERLRDLTPGEVAAIESIHRARRFFLGSKQGQDFILSPKSIEVTASDLRGQATEDEVRRVIEAWRALILLDRDHGVTLWGDAHTANWGTDDAKHVKLFDFGASGLRVGAEEPKACDWRCDYMGNPGKPGQGSLFKEALAAKRGAPASAKARELAAKLPVATLEKLAR